MKIITKENLLEELQKALSEFKDQEYKASDLYDGSHYLIFADLRRLTEAAAKNKNDILLKKILQFIIRCFDSEDKLLSAFMGIGNALFVSFFENMESETLEYFLKNLPPQLAKEIEIYR